MAGAHSFCELSLGEDAGEVDLVGRESGEEGAYIVLNPTDDGELFVGVLKASEGLKEVGDAFAKGDLPGKEDFEGAARRFSGAGELIETDAIGDDVNLFGCDAHLDEGTFGDCRGNGDGVGGVVDFFFACPDVRLGEGLRQMPAAIFFGDEIFLIALVG